MFESRLLQNAERGPRNSKFGLKALKAVVLAGGRGTRLRPLTYTRPKPLLPLVGEPAIVHLIRKLAHEGIRDIVMTTNFFAGWLRAALGDGSRYGARIEHVEEKAPLGTAGSVKNSESLIDETFLVVQGDNQFEFDPKDVINIHRKVGASATLALVEVENPSEYGIAELSDGRITRFLEKPKPEECFSNLVNSGFYVVEPEVLKLVPAGKPFDFSKNLFPLMLESKMTLGGFHAKGFWVDIGDPASYLKANIWALNRLEPKGKIIHGSGCSISEKATLKGPSYLGNNVKVHEGTRIGPHSCVYDGTQILTGTEVTSSIVYENTQIGRNVILDTCVVAENCQIGDRVQIGRDAVVGGSSELGDDSHLIEESKVGPWAIVANSSVVSGTSSAFEIQADALSSILERSSLYSGLSIEEAKVCSVLWNLREADTDAISRFARVPRPMVISITSDLHQRGLLMSFGDEPRMYALAVRQGKND